MSHTTESLLAAAWMFVKNAALYERLDHECAAYKEYAHWRNTYDELTATTA